MGFLQNSTNNILLDAVLTDTGRQFLARNDNSFSIVKFALGDDEVDYSVIQKFGRTVGSEKIEKNTPIFEALTNQNFAQKYRLISISNPNLIRLPTLSIAGGVTSFTISTPSKTTSVVVQQTIQNENSIDVELRDQAFEVKLNNLFLSVAGNTPDNIDGQQTATYLLPRDSVQTSTGGSQLTFTLQTQSVTSTQFAVFGTAPNRNQIITFVRVSGLQSGAVNEFQVIITPPTST